MTRRHKTARGDRPNTARWSRHKMLTLLAGAALMTMVLVVGLVISVIVSFSPAHPGSRDIRTSGSLATRMTTRPSSQPSEPRAIEDSLAARSMPTVGEDASHPGPVSTRDPGATILLPPPTATGPAGVPTGFGHTPDGAMAQLAAIDQAALQSGSLAGARTVIAAWALPGGPTATSWSVVAALGALFDAAGLSGGGSPQLALVLTPLMGLVKGSVGADFTVPCIDFELDVTLTLTARGATADCQRMAWNGVRWMIAPGAEPATPPSVWPDTDTAIAVGYRDLRPEPRHA